jgi:hypothetical protein
LDTGAVRSLISAALAEQLRLTTEATAVKLQLADGSHSPDPISRTSQVVRIELGNRSSESRLLVGKHLCYELILGADLLPSLGISLLGLPTMAAPDSTPGVQAAPHSDDLVVDRRSRVEDPLPASDRERIASGIADLMKSNQRIDRLCSHALAPVQLDTGEAPPVLRRQYPIPHHLRGIVTEKVDAWLERNQIVVAPPECPYNLPLTVARKKDLNGERTKYRVCLDPRAINDVLADVAYEIPLISDLLERVSGSQVLSTLDIAEAYHQLPIVPEDQMKLAFTWNGTQYMFCVAPFGLKFLTAHFQRMMSAIFAQFGCFVVFFVDDIVVFSKTIIDHIEHLRVVINELNKWNLRLSPEKCKLGFKTAAILGHVVSGSTIAPDPVKLSTFASMSRPETGSQVASILGFTNYLRQFVPLYAAVTSPLEKLRKHKRIAESEWGAQQEEAWTALKNILSTPPVLSQPRRELSFCVASDASQFGVGGVLYQLDENDHPLFVSFVSRALNVSQRNYPAMRREMLGVLYSLAQFHDWIAGTRFKLYTDHAALRFLLEKPHTNRTLQYWSFVLAEYDFEVFHRPGVLNILPDCLSRLYPPWIRGGDDHSMEEGKVLLAATSSNSSSESTEPKDAPEHSIAEFIRERLGKEEPLPGEREQLLQRHHALAHEGHEALFKRIWGAGYFWRGMRKDCVDFCSRCDRCLEFSVVHKGFHPLTSIESRLPMDHVGVDLFGPLPTSSSGFNFGLVLVDLFTRFIVVRSLRSKSAADVASELYRIFCIVGFPRIMQSDNGSEFVNETVKAMKDLIGLDHRTISPYYPQSNGASEANVKLVKRLLKKRVAGDWSSWDLHLPIVQYALNTRISRRHGSTPFTLMFARSPMELTDHRETPALEDQETAVEKWLDHHRRLEDVVFPALRERTRSYSSAVREAFDKKHKLTEFPVGALVMLSTTDRARGLDPTYSGPFKVLKRNRGGAYQLLDATGALHPSTVPPSRLRLVSLPQTSPTSAQSAAQASSADAERGPPPAPAGLGPMVAEEAVYEVERVVSHRGPPNARYYLIKWRGYPSSQNTWEPAANIQTSGCVAEYWRSQSPAKK